jgi:hypoxanthine-guanine phosphoribosyltransferase
MLKTYRIYRGSSKSITIIVDDKPFTPRFLAIGNCMDYSTRDKKIQKALEADRRFKVVFHLINVGDEGGEVKEEKTVKQPEKLNYEVKKEDVVVVSDVSDITTIQQAKAYLRAKGIEIAKTASVEKVIEVGNANGINFYGLTVNEKSDK